MISVWAAILGNIHIHVEGRVLHRKSVLVSLSCSQNRNMVSPVTYKLLYNSLTLITTCSFLHCLTNSQTSLTSANCINLQDFVLCSLISYTVDDPTLWVLHTLCTDVLLSWLCSISTICCMDNTGFCLQALFSWVIFRIKHGNKLILAQNSEIYTHLAPGLWRTKF